MMGPNAMRLSEEMASCLDIKSGMRVLDLGCGCGLSTLLLAKKYDVSVFAADLWISPTDNYARFQAMGIGDRTVPISVDATKGLPFANGYFDLLFTVDSYHYFGDTPEMLPSLLPFVKQGGAIAIAIPGIRYEFGENVPQEMKPFWNFEIGDFSVDDEYNIIIPIQYLTIYRGTIAVRINTPLYSGIKRTPYTKWVHRVSN